MDVYFIALLILIFFGSLIIAKYFGSIPMAIVASIVCIILGGIVAADKIEIPIGLNKTLENNNTIITDTIYQPIPDIYNNSISLTFFILTFYCVSIVFMIRRERANYEDYY